MQCRPSGLALLPGLDRARMLRFVDQGGGKEGLVSYLKERQKQRKMQARDSW
jgi:hypothetical protein